MGFPYVPYHMTYNSAYVYCKISFNMSLHDSAIWCFQYLLYRDKLDQEAQWDQRGRM